MVFTFITDINYSNESLLQKDTFGYILELIYDLAIGPNLGVSSAHI